MAFTEIQTARLLIRRLDVADAAEMATYRSDPLVAKFQSRYSIEKAEQLIQEMKVSDPSVQGKWFQFAIELKDEKALIGDIGFLNTDENGKSWVGYTLSPSRWGQGFASEAVAAVLDYYTLLGLKEVWASTDPKNEASMKLCKNLRFALVEQTATDVIFRKALS